MATGFGFCPNCGSALTEAGQKFCSICGAVLAAAQAGPGGLTAQPSAGAPVPPPPPVLPTPPDAAGWATPAGIPAAAAPSKGVSPAMLLIGGIVIVAIVAGAVFAMSQSRSSSSPGAGGGGAAVSIRPSTFSCLDEETRVTVEAWLPGSMAETAEVSLDADGQTFYSGTVGDGFVRQPDGRWLSSAPFTPSDICGSFGAGRHTIRILDANGKVLASASFTGQE
jgi:hypothetical protein